MRRSILFFLLAFSVFHLGAQEPPQLVWKHTIKKESDSVYLINFNTTVPTGWQLYAPGQMLDDVPAAQLTTGEGDTTAQLVQTTGAAQNIKSNLFSGQTLAVQSAVVSWQYKIAFDTVPAVLNGKLAYSYGRGDEFYPGEYEFTETLLKTGSSTNRILIPAINVTQPVAPCGDDDAANKSLAGIFFLGFVGGLIALLTPCVFPLIPLTVSFFTKRSGNRAKGLRNGLFYGFCIFAIYALLSLPFYLLDSANPEILNNISTNVWLNLLFFVLFVVFALSFFGLYEIGLPASFANRVDSKSGVGDFGGIFFMALTLAIVSFSCTGPILGSLLAGALTNNGGAVQLTSGMSGFGLGLALPFALFALFPGWLQTLPKSGGWLTTVKVVLGFIELAMAVKFLSNADLVKQWGFLKREVFIGIWILIGAATVLYLLGVIRFGQSAKPKMTPQRIGFAALFALITLYLVPGVTNTKAATLPLISGFPPPVCYSVYTAPVACEKTIEPMKNDYEAALALAKKEGKPLLIDFTGWACVNCRRMEEKVWTDPEVARSMREDFIVVSLYVDEKKALPSSQQFLYTTKGGDEKFIRSVGDKWATFQAENFNAVAQPQYAIIGANEQALTKTKAYTPDAKEFISWLSCGLQAYQKK